MIYSMNTACLSYMPKLLGAIALSMAIGTHILEYFFGYQGCFLCHVERAILFVAGVCTLYRFKSGWSTLAWGLGSAVTLYHIGVQQKWFPLTKFCKAYMPRGETLEAQMQDFLSHAHVSCDQITLRILTVPATVFLAGFFISGFVMCIMWRRHKVRR